ncbi:hypothetical protein [Streptomyces parvulus]|uniref:hypothetical protein n=1 Tax=Streptomyces parvulus TaxID=146923 RepID=UPI0011C046DF|nr:hypothetical protein [Streptomyces parvulus]
MTNIIERYTWEDSLIEAETLGLLPSGAVNMCLRLAKAINWKPGNHRKGKPSGLYWKNEDALKAVNSSRATYFRYRKTLFDLGFFTEEKGNLIPQIPDLSHIETAQSQIETPESHIETGESQTDTPYSEDTYSEDVSTEDVSSEDRDAVSASDKELDISRAKEDKESSNLSLPVVSETPSLLLEEDAAGTADDDIDFAVYDSEGRLLGEHPAPVADSGLDPVVESLLNGAEHPSEARALFLDPEWEPEKTGELRARWAAFMAEPALTH